MSNTFNDEKPDPFTEAFRDQMISGLGWSAITSTAGAIYGGMTGGNPLKVAGGVALGLGLGTGKTLHDASEAGHEAYFEANPAQDGAFSNVIAAANDAVEDAEYQRDLDARIAELEADLARDAAADGLSGALDESYTLNPDTAPDGPPENQSGPPDTRGNLDDTLPPHPDYEGSADADFSADETSPEGIGDAGAPTDGEIEAVIEAIEAMDDGTKDFAQKAEAAIEEYARSLGSASDTSGTNQGEQGDGGGPDNSDQNRGADMPPGAVHFMDDVMKEFESMWWEGKGDDDPTNDPPIVIPDPFAPNDSSGEDTDDNHGGQ